MIYSSLILPILQRLFDMFYVTPVMLLAFVFGLFFLLIRR